MDLFVLEFILLLGCFARHLLQQLVTGSCYAISKYSENEEDCEVLRTRRNGEGCTRDVHEGEMDDDDDEVETYTTETLLPKDRKQRERNVVLSVVVHLLCAVLGVSCSWPRSSSP